MKRKILIPLALISLTALPACDWFYSAFFNSIPFHGDPAQNPVVHVFLAIDGLSHASVKEVQARGAFSGGRWSLAKFISNFPATSDYSWSRILHTQPIAGYEFEHYNPVDDNLLNAGFLGVVKHALPTLADFI